MKKLSLSLLPHKYAVCQFHPDKHIPYWALLGDFVSLTRTPEELSIVCQQDNVPDDIEAERGWCCVQVQGAFDFSVAGFHFFLAILPPQTGIRDLAIFIYSPPFFLYTEGDFGHAFSVFAPTGPFV